MKSTNSIEMDTIVVQIEGLVAADMDGEKVMLNITTGKYFGLDQVGSRIWELIETPCAVYEIIQSLRLDYEVHEETCQKDVLTFLGLLQIRGLITIV
ncbi:lasso peptide biosynthesis PqqD family chaperone [Azotosporobacter soli]|uniref:lasso peptide biosynthesis PqqD family chaperone n=1 Tax=Azotosporobacter soli TaxID=3055040 RepID=UPI0031FE66E6